MPAAIRFQESRMPGNPLVRFDEGRVGRTARGRPLSYSTGLARYCSCFPESRYQNAKAKPIFIPPSQRPKMDLCEEQARMQKALPISTVLILAALYFAGNRQVPMTAQ